MLLLGVVYCLAGALTTIAVAWGLVFFVGSEREPTGGSIWDSPDVDDETATRWRHLQDEGIDRHGVVIVVPWYKQGSLFINLFIGDFQHGADGHGLEADSSVIESLPIWCDDYLLLWLSEDNGEDADVRSVDARGWPVLSLWCAPPERTALRLGIDETYGGFPLKKDTAPGRIPTLPYLPIWHGFFFNTLFYALLWFALFFSISRLRRGVHRLRGRCSRCGYQLHGGASTGCSECGWGRSKLTNERN